MYNNDMKMLIKYAIELDITALKTFEGYKGGSILSFNTYEDKVVNLIKSFCHKMEVDTNIKQNRKTKEYEIFCVFGTDRFAAPEDDSIFELKDPN